MPRNFNRRISATTPTKPNEIDRPSIKEVQGKPVFDKRYLSWRLRNPSHKQANDEDLTERGRDPRQQADASCNIIQLYEHIEYYALQAQTEYGHYEGNSRVLIMPYQEITPQTGWKLYDKTAEQTYTVKEALLSHDHRHQSTFDGRILLSESVGPPENHLLEWHDPFGEADGVPKVLRFMHKEDIRPLLQDREANASGDVSEVRGVPFTPVVGYALVRREPASISNHPFGPARELGHRVRMVVRDPDNPDTTQKIWGQWFDCIVEFQTYALGPKIADRINVWVEQFFMRYNHVLMQLGVQKALPWSERRNKEEARVVHDLSIRTTEIYFRLEDIQVEVHGQIKSYNMQLQTQDSSDSIPWFTSEPDQATYPVDTSEDFALYGAPDVGDDYS